MEGILTRQNGVWKKIWMIVLLGIVTPAITFGLLLLCAGTEKLLSAAMIQLGVSLGEFTTPLAVTFTLSGLAIIYVILESLI